MNTAWGELAVSDAHIHFFSQNFFRLLAAQKQPSGSLSLETIKPLLQWEMPPQDPAALAAHWIGELDRHGVGKAALIASLPADAASVETAVNQFPQRFRGYYMVNPLESQAAPPGVPCLFPAMHQYALSDACVGQLLQSLAGRPNPVVFIHCGVLSVGVRAKLGLPSRFDLRYSNPADVYALAMKHSGIRFVIPHFGAGYFREALMVADCCPNVYFDTSSSNGWMKYEGLTLPVVFKRALDILGPSRLLFGTDSSFFPRGWNRPVFEAQAAALAEIGVSTQTAQQIFAANFDQLLP